MMVLKIVGLVTGGVACYSFLAAIIGNVCRDEVRDQSLGAIAGIVWPVGLPVLLGLWVHKRIKGRLEDRAKKLPKMKVIE